MHRLGRDLDQTVIVDNSPLAFAYHLERGIPIDSWFGVDEEDNELLVTLELLEKIDAEIENIPHFLRDRFKLRRRVWGL